MNHAKKAAPSGLSYAEAKELVGAEALKKAATRGTGMHSNWVTKRQDVPWKIIGPIIAERLRLAAARSSQETTDPTLTAPEARMTAQDHRAWMVFIELLKHHKTGRQLRKWNAVRDVLLDFEDAQEQARQTPEEKPALSVEKAAL